MHKLFALFALLIALFSTAALAAAAPLPSTASVPVRDRGQRYFAETRHYVQGGFLEYWGSHGGLAQLGYPLSEELTEQSMVDNQVYTVQYFERAVFEYHPNNAPGSQILLSLLGRGLYARQYQGNAPRQVANRGPGSRTFAQTGKTVGGLFLAYWRSHGGLAQQGYPISEEFPERSATNGTTHTVQYFERAVFEYHPENATPYQVLLAPLGKYEIDRWHPSNSLQAAPPADDAVDWGHAVLQCGIWLLAPIIFLLIFKPLLAISIIAEIANLRE